MYRCQRTKFAATLPSSSDPTANSIKPPVAGGRATTRARSSGWRTAVADVPLSAVFPRPDAPEFVPIRADLTRRNSARKLGAATAANRGTAPDACSAVHYRHLIAAPAAWLFTRLAGLAWRS